jgi:hypothetical protein
MRVGVNCPKTPSETSVVVLNGEVLFCGVVVCALAGLTPTMASRQVMRVKMREGSKRDRYFWNTKANLL